MYFLILDACVNPTVLRVLYFAIIIRDIVFTIIPIAMISIMMLNFSKAVIASKEEEQIKSITLIPKRITYAIIVFSIPWVVHIVMKIADAFDFKLGGDYLLCMHNAEKGDFEMYDEIEEEEDRRIQEEQYGSVIDSAESPSRSDDSSLISGNKADNLVDEMIRIARAKIGTNNDDGTYGTAGLAWCAMFTTWVMNHTEVDGVNLYKDIIQREHMVTNSAGAGCTMYSFENSSNLRFYYSKYYAENVSNARKSDANYIPKKGDIIYFHWRHKYDGKLWDGEITSTCPSGISHVGIVEYVEGNVVHTIEGNNSNKVGRMQYNINGTSKWSGADIVGYGSWYSEGGEDASTESDEIDNVKNEIENFIDSKGYNISLLYYNLNTGYTYKYNEDIDYYGASTIKTLDILYYYFNGKPDTVPASDLKDAIYSSNNEAHKRNVKAFGLENYRKYASSLGVDKKIVDTITAEDNNFGETNLKTQLIYLKKLYGLIENMDDDTAPKSYFINPNTNCLKYSGSPTTMHKYGWGRDGKSFHDVGIVLDGKNPYIVIILTEGGNDANCGMGGSTVTNLSKLVYQLHKKLI